MRNEALNASSAKFKSRLWVDSDSSRHVIVIPLYVRRSRSVQLIELPLSRYKVAMCSYLLQPFRS